MTSASEMALIDTLYRRLDALDARAAAEAFEADGSLQFAHHPRMSGRQAISAGLDGFFAHIRGMSHRVVRRWSQDGSVVVQSEVTYVRPDRTETVVPAMARYDIHGDAIRSGHVFIDTAPVFRPGQ